MSETRRVDIPTGGMHCRSCESLIELTVGDLPGVVRVRADHGSGVTHVEFDPEAVGLSDLVEAIRSAGYEAASPED